MDREFQPNHYKQSTYRLQGFKYFIYSTKAGQNTYENTHE